MASEEAPDTPIRLRAEINPRVSFALHQNAVPFLLALTVENTSDRPLEDIVLTLHTVPTLVRGRSWRLDRLEPGEDLPVKDLVTDVDGGLLGRLTEAEMGQVTLTASRGEAVLGQWAAEVELLARNQWGGLDPMPQLVAAFIQPNDPAVDRVLRRAADILRDHGVAPDMDGYGSGGRERAWALAQAIWGAVCGLGLAYALPPANFERSGQKVRSPSQIWEGRVGTCLDTSLLFAACLEQCRLHPLVVVLDGHALVGCWLVDDCFPGAVVDDAATVRTRIQLGEMVVFETTLATHRPAPTFATAVAHARQALADGQGQAFVAAIDVRRARMERILPLASAAAAVLQAEQSPAEAVPPAFEAPPSWAETAGPSEGPAAVPGEGRLVQWQGKLLDLTLRNRLLNFRWTRGALPLDAPDPGGLEDRLAQGRPLRLVPRPPLMTGADPRSADLHAQRGGAEIVSAYAKTAMERGEVTVGVPPDELTGRLLALYRSARTSLQENGANTLHLAVGFLLWKRDERQAQPFRAPLILMPVTLSRSSVRAGFRLSLDDEEPKFNLTLLQMLERDFQVSMPELREGLPHDDSGIDIPAVWRLVADRVKEIRGWEVVPEVALSTFSFTKFLMWKDMVDRLEALQRNRVVQHLVLASRQPYPHVQPFPERRALDARYAAAATYCPLPTDSSQLAAVMAAADGQDFVLIGPPGTGKSQTIANLICHCLAEGKSVLFIAEKTAALEVVNRRLEAAGLGPFCLELHSNKTNKQGVLAQLERARATADVEAQEVAGGPAGAWGEAVAKVQALRLELNGFVQRMHGPHSNGLTIFSAIARVLSGPDVPEISLSWPTIDAHDGEQLAGLGEQARRLDTHAAAAGLRPADPLMPVRQRDWSTRWQASLLAAARQIVALGAELQTAAGAFCAAAGVQGAGLDAGGRERLARLAALIIDVAKYGWGFVLREDARDLCDALRSGMSALERRTQVVSRLSLPYDLEAALRLDLAALRGTWEQAGGAWWLRRVLLQRGVRRALIACVPGRAAAPATSALADLERLAEIRALDQQVAALEGLRTETNGLWRGLETDPEAVRAALERHGALQDAVGQRHRFPARGSEPDGLGELARQAQGLRQTLDRWREAVAPLQAMVAADDTPAGWAECCAAILGNTTRLQAWCVWQRERQDAMGVGLAPLVEALEQGRIAPGAVQRAFEVNYCRWWLPGAIDADPALCAFVPAVHEHRIAEFAAADDRWLASVGPHVQAGLAASLKREMAGAARGSPEATAWGVLRHEAAKKKRHLPVRELLAQLAPILPVLAPCLLMSPLSVAQYLAADARPFDLVVFDEASQIPVWDAIGAIGRGTQLVVVGDPKQLPPTTFFDRAEEEPEDDEQALNADLESILDDCLGAGLPELQLNWHYRSRHESLIAFSNRRYYDNTLVTFPSAVTDDRAVQYHAVAEGIYEKGAERVNRAEARAVADFVLSRLRDPSFAHSGQSIGVVTFNAQQQQLIEDLFERERERDEALERFFGEDRPEPVFVKNLENVQGDERDVMCFSITYGPDERGAVSMNFGPLNKEGGERRLNVAITRARRELHIFATVQPEQIDVKRSGAKGVADLKHFLQYSQGHGPAAGQPALPGAAGEAADAFTGVVLHALQSRGWQVQAGIGASQLRVDIGVVDPDVPGGFLAGILCDGPTSDATATARDRDLLRQRVLEGLGWRVGRTWAMEWWLDPDGALDRLHHFLTEAQAGARAARTSPATAAEADGTASD